MGGENGLQRYVQLWRKSTTKCSVKKWLILCDSTSVKQKKEKLTYANRNQNREIFLLSGTVTIK